MNSIKTKLGVVAALGIGLLIVGGPGAVEGVGPNERTKLRSKIGEGAAYDLFGSAVATSGNIAVAGAFQHNSDEGAIYIFEHNGTGWGPGLKKQPLVPNEGDQFGWAVDIDGEYIIIGARFNDDKAENAGAAYILKRETGFWQSWYVLVDEIAPAAEDWFGTSVAISGDYAIVGSVCCESDKGAVFVFKRVGPGNVWSREAKLTAPDGGTDHYFGSAVDINVFYAVVGAEAANGSEDGSGAAYVFTKPGAAWYDMTLSAKLTFSGGSAGDHFGCSVAMDGDDVVVGADNATVTVSTAGAAFVFEKPSGAWVAATETDTLIADDGAAGDEFGRSVDIVGDFVLAGAPADEGMKTDAGSLHLFKRGDTAWEERKLASPSGAEYERFGKSVSLSEDYVLGGMPGHDEYGEDRGAAFVYTRPVFDNRYFVHLADLHAVHKDNAVGEEDSEWEEVMRKVLRLRPPPDFVAVSGDLVDWGEKDSGKKNYRRLTESGILDIDPASGIHYLFDDTDATHRIPIYFAPGNHDYRAWVYGPTRRRLLNYREKINNTTFNFNLQGRYAIYTLDTRYDKFKKGAPWRPEGKGPSDNHLREFVADLGGLSEFVKVVMMHHPHESRRDWPNESDEEFLENKSWFVQLCKDYGVDYVLYGHCHKNESYMLGDTRCYITDAAKHGKMKEISTKSAEPWAVDITLWPTIVITYAGDVESYALGEDLDEVVKRTGLHPFSMEMMELGIVGATYSSYVDVVEDTGEQIRWAELSVHQTDTLDYTFVAEALSEGLMTIIVEEHDVDGTSREVTFTDVPMYYDGGASLNQGSIVTLQAPESILDYTLTIVDPGGEPRDSVPALTQWSARDIDLFQDTFPTNGTSVGTGRIDAAMNIAPQDSPMIIPGDSAVVTVFDPVSGIRYPDGYPGFGPGPAVYLYLARDSEIDPPANPMPRERIVEDSNRWPVVDSLVTTKRTWYMIRADTCIGEPAKYSFDVNDNFFTNGDTLWFFFGAENNDAPGQWSWWTQESGTVTDVNAACATAMEMQILPGAGPARGGDILFVDNLGAGDERPMFEWAFEMLGIGDKVDRFDKRGPAFCEGNSLGGRVTDASQQLIANYRKIIWNSGNEVAGTVGDGTGLPEKADDFSVLFEFIDAHSDAGGAGIYFSGNNLAEECMGMAGSSGADFRDTWMPFRLEDRDFAIEFGESPYVVGEPGGMFDHASGPDTIVAFGGLLDTNCFDVILPIGRTTLEMSYQNPPATPGGAVVSFDSTNDYGNQARVVLSGFSYHYIYDDVPAGVPDRAEHLGDILDWLGNDLGQPVGAAETPVFRNTLSQNHPNPFNPTTTIRYSIARPGHVSLRIYNVAGQLVKTLVNEKQLPQAGGFTIRWDGRNNKGSRVSSGVYFYQLKTDSFTSAKKMVLLQ